MSPTRAAATGRIRTASHLQFAEALTGRPLDGVALVVLRAPRGFGKTSLLGRWLELGLLGTRPVYVSLPSSIAAATDVWERLLDGLDRAGIAPPADRSDPREATGAVVPTPTPVAAGSVGGPAAVSAAITAHGEPLTLVIDHLHRIDDALDARLDQDLLDLLDRHPNLNLVVATRTLRALEITGLMSIPARFIGPAELRMDSTRAATLATALGARLSPAMTERLVSTTDGWPALVRTTLARSIHSEDTLGWDPTVIDAFLSRVIDDFGDERMRPFLYRTCLLGAFTLERAQALVGQSDALALLRPLHHAGLLRSDGPDAYTYAPAVRESLERLAREHHPELVKEVHGRLLRTSTPTLDPAQALHHALLAEEWEVGLQLVERYWNRLVTQSPHALIAAARAFPGECISASAHLRVALTDLAGGVVSTLGGEDRSWPWPVAGEPDGLASLSGAAGRPIEQDESVALLQWAIAALFCGDLHAATYACSRARSRGLAQGGGEAAALGTMGLALLHMFQGELVQGRRLLADPVLTSPRPATVGRIWGNRSADQNQQHRVAGNSAEAIVTQGVRLSRALDAVDSGSPDAAARVAELVDPVYRDLLWILTVSVRARHATLTDDPHLVLESANELRAALRYVAVGTLPEAILVHDLIDVLIRVGMLGVARDLDSRTGTYPLAILSRAKLAMAERQYHHAITLCESIGTWLSLWPRVALERDVVLASAYHAVGRGHDATELFLATVHTANVHGQSRPFGLMPRYVFNALAGHDRQIQLLWPDPRTRVGGDDPEQRPLPVFTDREAQVLRALVEHGGPVAIAQHLGLSTNTAKTHVRNIYRKLGVTNRSEALAAAERLLTG